ncbi:MAG: hypothetical protein JST73_00855 [Actinobacteria bacterium]|nr:hypothetical protein [Actinomycetota bacterium]
MSPASPTRALRETRREKGDREPHLRVVDAPASPTRQRVIVSVVLTLCFGVLLTAVAFHVHLATGQRHIDQLNRHAQASQETYDRLRLQVDQLSAPERIVARAHALGMVDAQNPTWLAPAGPALSSGGTADDPTMRGYLDVKPYLRNVP